MKNLVINATKIQKAVAQSSKMEGLSLSAAKKDKKIIRILKSKGKLKNGNFANFFLHASDTEKIRVFEEAARRSNDDQRTLVKNINKSQHMTT